MAKSRVARKVKRKAERGELPLWQEAAAFASRAHRHQIRRDGRTPYVSHVFRVAMTVSQVFGCQDPAVLSAALLHDTIEDTTTDYEDLSERFGDDVADMVAALTKNMSLPEEVREQEYDARIAKADWRVRLVKLGDVYDNYCDVKNWSEDEQRSSKTRRAREKCERAVELAKVDAGNEMTDRAVRAVRELIGR